MNIFKIICKEFLFLQNYGFTRKEYFGDGIEVIFEKDKHLIAILHYIGLNGNSSKEYCIDVIIEHAEDRQNLLNCNLFEAKELSLLKSSLQDKEIAEQIVMYARFLKNHIEILL